MSTRSGFLAHRGASLRLRSSRLAGAWCALSVIIKKHDSCLFQCFSLNAFFFWCTCPFSVHTAVILKLSRMWGEREETGLRERRWRAVHAGSGGPVGQTLFSELNSSSLFRVVNYLWALKNLREGKRDGEVGKIKAMNGAGWWVGRGGGGERETWEENGNLRRRGPW